MHLPSILEAAEYFPIHAFLIWTVFKKSEAELKVAFIFKNMCLAFAPLYHEVVDSMAPGGTLPSYP